jgi:hypothetical protein
MTVRDPEVLELLRDEPELLALADAVAETQRLPRAYWTRRPWPRALAAAGLAVAIVVAVLLAPGGGGKNPVLGRALAAIGDGRVLHLVMRSETGEVIVNLETGRRTVETADLELWSDRSFERAHLVMRARGVTGDLLLPEDMQSGVSVGSVDPAYGAFWTGYRQALTNGDAKLEREDVIGGKPVYWLRFPSVRQGQPGTEVAIDQRSYKPVLLRSYVSPTRHQDARILVAETIPYDAADFKRVGLNLFGGITSGSSGSGSLGPGAAKPELKAPWLTPGKRVAGLTLASVDNFNTTTGARTIEGLQLRYGEGFYGPRSLTIEELPHPDDPAAWNHVPSGSISIQKGEGSDDQHRTFSTWTGQLVKDGIYITIETGAGQDAVIEVARALHPA